METAEAVVATTMGGREEVIKRRKAWLTEEGDRGERR